MYIFHSPTHFINHPLLHCLYNHIKKKHQAHRKQVGPTVTRCHCCLSLLCSDIVSFLEKLNPHTNPAQCIELSQKLSSEDDMDPGTYHYSSGDTFYFFHTDTDFCFHLVLQVHWLSLEQVRLWSLKVSPVFTFLTHFNAEK